MPSMTLVSPVEIVGVKNVAGTQINPARKEDIEALPAADYNQIALLLMEMMQALQPLMNADASNRQRVAVEAMPTVTANATISSGTITNVAGTVRVEEAGGFGLRFVTFHTVDQVEQRRELLDVAFNTQLGNLIFT